MRPFTWPIGLGGQRLTGTIKSVHKDNAAKSKCSRIIKMVQWALDLGEKGCRRALKVLHKKEEEFDPQSTDRLKESLIQALSQPISLFSKIAVCFCERTEQILRKLVIQMRKVGTAEHIQKHISDGVSPSYTNFEDAWAGIATEVAECGISLDIVKKRRDLIVQCIVSNLVQESQQEGKEDDSESIKAATNKMKVEKEVDMIRMNDTNRPEMAAESGLAESVTHMEDTQTDRRQKTPEKALSETECSRGRANEWGSVNLDGQEVAGLRSPNTATEISNPQEADQGRVKSDDYECAPSESVSLVIGLRSANQDFDLEMSSNGQHLGSAALKQADPGVTGRQLGSTMTKERIPASLTPKVAEKTKRKLQMISSSSQKSEANSVRSNLDTRQNKEHDGPATQEVDQGNSDTMKEAIVLSETESRNQKLRMMLLKIQEPEIIDTKWRRIKRAGDEEEKTKRELDSRTLSSASHLDSCSKDSTTAVVRGRWFETLEGSLKRIENEQSHQESTREPKDGFSEKEKLSSKASVSECDNEDPAKILDLQPMASDRRESKTINIFRVPDDDEQEEDSEPQELPVEKTREDHGQLEDGDTGEGVAGSIGSQADETESSPSKKSSKAEMENESNGNEDIDAGYFTAADVCTALGNGNLDDERMAALKEGFMALLDDMVGKRK